MNGILLGSCKTEANRIECLVETDGMDMGGSGIPLEKNGRYDFAYRIGEAFLEQSGMTRQSARRILRKV